MTMSEDQARSTLENLRKYIDLSNPAKDDIPKNIQQLSPSKNAKEIKYFNPITKAIKEEFKQHLTTDLLKLVLKQAPTASGPETGKIWHSSIKRYIDDGRNDDELGKAVIDALKTFSPGITFLATEFPLYGYMTRKEDSGISFWNGKVDAIGWYHNKYVIIEWKAVDLLNFWEKNPLAYGDYLHQCLVYAQLLLVHLDLDSFPDILLVPISNQTGKEIRPGLFENFPKKSMEKLRQYEWSKELKPSILSLPSSMVKGGYVKEDGFVDEQEKLCDLFKEECTVKELLQALRFLKLKVE